MAQGRSSKGGGKAASKAGVADKYATPVRTPSKQSAPKPSSSKAASPKRPTGGGGAAASPPASPMQGMSTPQKIVWIALHALIFLVPIAISNANWLSRPPFNIGAFTLPLTYDQFDIVKVFVMRACALVGLGAWSFDFFMNGGKLRRTKVDWLILGFLGWVLLTSFTSVHIPTAIFGKYRRFEGFLSFLTYAIVYFLTVQVADRPSRIRSLAHTLVVSGTIVALYGVMQYLGIDPIRWVGEGQSLPFEFNRGFSTFGNPDLLGGYLIFPLPIALAMALSEKRTVWRAVYWGVTLVVIAAWITAFVRGAWIGGAVALLAVVIAAVLARVPWGNVDWAAAGVTAGATALVIGRSLQSQSDVLNIWTRLQSIFKFNEGSALTRFEIWEAALRAVKERPIFGWGADTFRLVFPATKPLSYTRDAGYLSVADNVHNYPLQLGSALGVPGFLLLYGLFGWMLWLGFPGAFSRGKGPERLILTGFWAAALGYILHLMFGLSVTGSTVFLWLSFALLLAPTATTHEYNPRLPAVSMVLLAVCTLAFVYNIVYVVADNHYLKAQFGGAGVSQISEIQTTIRLNPFNDMYRSQLGQTYQSQMAGWLQEARTRQTQNQDTTEALQNARAAFQLAETSFKDVISFVPTEYDNYVFLAALYNQAGAYFDVKYYDEAIRISDQGIAVEPYGPAIRFQKALALLSQGKTEESIKVLEALVPMDPNYTDPIAVLGDAYVKVGRLEDARTTYRKLLEKQPNNAQAKQALEQLDAKLTSGTPATTAP